MNAIRTIIVDDEPLAIEGLKIRLAAFEDVAVVASCPNGRKAIETIRKLKPDLVLLDIQMPGLSGFDVVKTLVGSVLPLVVFVTAFDEYALKAFEAHALDYLLKPVDEGRLRRALQRARKALHEQTVIEQNARLVKLIEGMQNPPAALISAMLAEPASPKPGFETHISIKDRGRITRVAVEDIRYIDAASDYMCIHAGDKTHILRATMKDLEKRLDPSRFQRVHRSAIVNVAKVKELQPHSNGEYFLFLDGGGQVKVSRSYKSVIARFL